MSDTIQQIKDKLDIVDVIAPYVELKKAGKNYKGKSPFTSEKTPSFYVSPDRGMYYCFSTSQGGDMFTFVQAMEGVDFKGALAQLAQKAGVELVAEDPKKRSERDRWYASLTAAVEFYQAELKKNSEAKTYLLNRGVTQQTIGEWKIGYAPGPPQHGWRETKEALETQGYTREELITVGLIKTTEGGKEPFDVFRDRIVFPMSDTSGRAVAFSGRILTKDSDAPKYVNSPETPLYKKSELLYGYDKAKTGIRNLGFSLIVEGQFDVVMAHQAGYHNTVAVSGTALTPQHVQLLERLSDKVVLALDADRAGIAAMKKGAHVMLGRGLDVKVAPLPEGQDPADIIASGVANFKKVIGESVHVIEFLLNVLKKSETDPRTLKLKAREEILPFVLLLPNRIDQEHFVSVIAAAIGSTTDAIRFEVDRLREEQKLKRPEPVSHVASVTTTVAPEKDLGGSIQSAFAYLSSVVDLLDEQQSAVLREQLAKLPTQHLELDVSLQAKITFMLEEQMAKQPKLGLQEDVISRLNFLRQKLLQQQLTTMRAALTKSEQSGEETESLMKQIQVVQEELRIPALTINVLTQQG